MQFTSILGETPYHLKPSEIKYPSYFKDLNLDQIIEKILEKRKDYKLEKYFYYPALTEEVLLFRREIFLALSDYELKNAMIEFSMSLKKSRKFMEYREDLLNRMQYFTAKKSSKSSLSISTKTASEIKCQHFLFDSARLYSLAVTKLFSVLEKQISKEKALEKKSVGFLSFYEFLKTYCSSDDFTALCLDVQKTEQSLSLLTFCMELSGTKLILHDDYEIFNARDEIIKRCNMKSKTASSTDHNHQTNYQTMFCPFSNILELEDFEGLLLSMLHKGHKDVFQNLEEFSKKYSSFYEPLLLQFEEEIQVYLAVKEFTATMQERGFSFSFPEIVSFKENTNLSSVCFLLQDNYDLALACKYSSTPEKVIKNDCSLFSKEHFFVITGPNQGGKTTFARAVGQAIYFHQMGFPIAGTKASIPVFSTLLTHFPTEEDVKTGSGKLKEELSRLEPMTHSNLKHGFVILNELFTTATSYDAEIMGKQVLQSFMKKHFLGIYVTHMQELAQTWDTGIVSIIALVDKDKKTRTYHIVRAKPKGIAYAQTIAEKYRLRYEDILKRVKK